MMRAITLRRPWDQAILHGGKDIENRVWPLWTNQIGCEILLHASKKYDIDGAIWMQLRGLYNSPSEVDSPTGIVGSFVVDRVVTESNSPWFVGPFGWVLRDIKIFEKPIPCRGKQGLWIVPNDILRGSEG